MKPKDYILGVLAGVLFAAGYYLDIAFIFAETSGKFEQPVCYIALPAGFALGAVLLFRDKRKKPVLLKFLISCGTSPAVFLALLPLKIPHKLLLFFQEEIMSGRDEPVTRSSLDGVNMLTVLYCIIGGVVFAGYFGSKSKFDGDEQISIDEL